MRNKLKIIAISDTHGTHNKIEIPKCDILIHAGDISSNGKLNDCVDFLKWFDRQPATHKIFIAGNHDFLFYDKPALRKDFFYLHFNDTKNIYYLQDETVQISGINFYGIPWTPEFYNWAFMKERGEEMKVVTDKIPFDTHVLISHGPPKGILDITTNNESVGCAELRERVSRLNNLKYHIFGHIHESYGVTEYGGTTFINASILNFNYKITNKPIEFEI